MKKLLTLILIGTALVGCTANKQQEEAASTETPQSQPVYACRTINLYNYGSPAPASATADETYFSDTLMVGDSRMGGIALYADSKGAEVYYTESVNLLTIGIAATNNDPSRTIEQILETTTKNNIYILLGINEIRAASFDVYLEAYQEVISMLKSNNENVNIYLMKEYMPQVISGLSDEQMRTQVNTLNEGIQNLAIENSCYIIDLDQVLAADNGEIKDEYTFDGLHMNPDGANAAMAYIADHTVRGEDYVKEICE